VIRKLSVAAALVGIVWSVGILAQKGGGDETGPYDLVAGWPQNYCGEGHVIGSTAGIWAESPDRVYIFSRGCLPVIKETGGAANSFIPSRNASGYDLSQKDPGREVLALLETNPRALTVDCPGVDELIVSTPGSLQATCAGRRRRSVRAWAGH